MNKITYVSNLELTNVSGGMSGINNATYNKLKVKVGITDYLAISPSQDFGAKIKSKILMLLGVKSNYHFFSERRLSSIAKSFKKSYNSGNEVFFHGFTPWIKTKPSKPYYCFNDACFATYVSLYNNRNIFSEEDLGRIFKQESEWLSKAKTVFFQSNWALMETKKAYNIIGSNFVNVGVGGYIDIPEKDEFKNGFNFLFISREFIPKGGDVVIEAFKKLRRERDDVFLWIVGEQPEDKYTMLDGVEYKGFFDKNDPKQKQALLEIFKNAFTVLHPTKKDINPLILSELGYYGCPAIASNAFAIPEYVKDGVTGFLLQDATNATELSEKMEYLLSNELEYKKMRYNVRKYAIENNTWDAVGLRISNIINNKDIE